MQNSATNPETGEQICISEIVKKQKDNRKNEVYCLMKGIEKLAIQDGLDWCFAVLTAPPQYHPNPSFSSSKWDGSMPVDSHNFISALWKKTTDELRLKHEINLAGFWSSESHQDGCAHRNVVFFCHPSELKTVEETTRKYFSWHEKAVEFRKNNGGAKFASYAMKYALKSLNCEVGDPEKTWHSVHSIRHYQFFGIPNLSTWRTLRSLTPEEKKEKEKEKAWTKKEESIWRAARRGDAATFTQLNGGLGVKQKDRPLKAKTESKDSIKKIEVISEGEIIFESSRATWKILSTPRKPNKDGKLTVILKLSKEPQNQTPDPRFTGLEPINRPPNRPPTLH